MLSKAYLKSTITVQEYCVQFAQNQHDGCQNSDCEIVILCLGINLFHVFCVSIVEFEHDLLYFQPCHPVCKIEFKSLEHPSEMSSMSFKSIYPNTQIMMVYKI